MFENYVGQEHIKKVLTGLINYHVTSQEPLQHILITGSSGLGKTVLSNEIAKALGTNFKALLATTATDADIVEAVCSMQNKDILFIDEIHALNKKATEVLFPVMAEGILYARYKGTVQRFKVSKFTIIGATDRVGLLNPALLNRFQLSLNLKPYTIEEFSQLIRIHTKGFDISDSMCILICKLCKGVPRILINIINSIKIYLKSINKTKLEKEDLDAVREFLGVDELGLNNIDIALLKYLNDNNTASLQTLASVCGCLATNIENLHEPYLLRLGFIKKESTGRSITQSGRDYLYSSLTI